MGKKLQIPEGDIMQFPNYQPLVLRLTTMVKTPTMGGEPSPNFAT